MVKILPVHHRFIPTCVGNSTPTSDMSLPFPVHPHVCGELSSVFSSLALNVGSSPRVWGTPQYKSNALHYQRFIPTCVGNSYEQSLVLIQHSVHPHVCGELLVIYPIIICPAGSSPRVWGTLGPHLFYPKHHRFIPTCVGNSYTPDFVLNLISVHPHVCGELIIP